MKAVGAAVAVIAEVVMELADLAVWKAKLKGKIPKAVNAWKKEASATTITDLQKLRDENVTTIREIADEIEADIEAEDVSDIDDLRKMAEMSEKIGKEIKA